MYYTKDELEKALSITHKKITRKPWNVRKNDVIILSQYGMGFLNSGFIPAEITNIRAYPEFRRSDTIPTQSTRYSHKTFRFYQKALNATDQHRMIGWDYTEHFTFDDVEIWRPNTPKKEQ